MSTKTTTLAWKRRGHPHAQVHLPPLTGEEALLLCNLMDRAITALWRTHGDAMADLLTGLDPEAAVSTEPSLTVMSPAPESDIEDIF